MTATAATTAVYSQVFKVRVTETATSARSRWLASEDLFSPVIEVLILWRRPEPALPGASVAVRLV